MDYILTMTFTTTGGKNVAFSISDVKNNLTQQQIIELMDIMIEKNVFATNSGSLVARHSAQVTERKITKFDVE